MAKVVIIGAGISGLATAYTLEQLAKKEQVPLQITLVEKELRCGGKIWSLRDHGYLCEWGPNGFLDNKPATLELCEELGLGPALQRSNDNARKRFVFSAGKLHQLPEKRPDVPALGAAELVWQDAPGRGKSWCRVKRALKMRPWRSSGADVWGLKHWIS